MLPPCGEQEGRLEWKWVRGAWRAGCQHPGRDHTRTGGTGGGTASITSVSALCVGVDGVTGMAFCLSEALSHFMPPGTHAQPRYRLDLGMCNHCSLHRKSLTGSSYLWQLAGRFLKVRTSNSCNRTNILCQH